MYSSSLRRVTTVTLTAAVTAATVTVLGTGSAGAAPCDTYSPNLIDRASALLSSGSGSSGSSGSSSASGSLTSWAGDTPWDLPNVSGPTEAMYMVTGPNSPDETQRLGLASTDLGFMWDAGEGRTLLAFGDSFGCDSGLSGWHSNALFSSHDTDPSDGLYLDGTVNGERSGEFLPVSLKEPGVEHTKIPTSGIEVNGDQYVDFMSVKSWGNAGQWTTNYAQTVKSTDGGKEFRPVDVSTRASSRASGDDRIAGVTGDSAVVDNFQMTALTKHTEDGTEYIYAYGTPSGRDGSARLARIAENDFPDWSAADYWDGEGWSDRFSDAAIVLDGRVSELSVQFNEDRGRWLAMYESTEGIVLREATSPTGPWSSRKTVVSRLQVPDAYGSFMLPTQDPADPSTLYFVMTTWSGYNTAMMRTDLDRVLG
ncbi:hypothetical protein CGLY_09350 [Corynebacterium glyciniphilum AJ 3170]|uniref:DUF4185 domain-containing protein n=1 Tax=Corynebacterium glyciniphilum AJ 3170 TaxID=1404245 RepID=X5EAA4_9CORY|nr:DUF4185 domain-containing protein [Corynebacterium glyciniphilum]AHW64315.1 hypothetical protein CGLY_09350 [Corynebacterium glyciniphilum AJ 3170]